MKRNYLTLFCLIIICTVMTVSAQDPKVERKVTVTSGNAIVTSAGTGVMIPTFDFVTANGFAETKTVKNAPFAAEFSSENVQTLADGNRIVRSSTTNVYRDGEGRMRREQSFAALGALFSNGEKAPRSIFIYDPVANASYVLNSNARTAFRNKTLARVEVNTNLAKPQPHVKILRDKLRVATVEDFPRPLPQGAMNSIQIAKPPFEKPRVDELGTQNIEGVEAEGKRITTIIPAGAIGNERQIEITNETWYSKELGMVVMSRSVNPMSGEHTYKLTSLTRNEQPRSLFEIPTDYKITDAPAGLNRMFHFQTNNDGKNVFRFESPAPGSEKQVFKFETPNK